MPNQVMVRCFPAELKEEQILKLVDVLRFHIGPIRYARFLVEDDKSRPDTVAFVSFYRYSNNQKCIDVMKHSLQWMLPHDYHYVQFVPNHDNNVYKYDNWPHTQIRVYDLEEELIRFAMDYEDPEGEWIRDIEEERPPNQVTTTIPSDERHRKVNFMEEFYQKYLEKTSQSKIIRVWESIKLKPDRLGIGYEEEKRERFEAMQVLVERLVRFDPGYENYRDVVHTWSMWKLYDEIDYAYYRNERRKQNSNGQDIAPPF